MSQCICQMATLAPYVRSKIGVLAARSSRPSGFGMASLATLLLLGAADVSREQREETMLFTTKTWGCRNLKVIPWVSMKPGMRLIAKWWVYWYPYGTPWYLPQSEWCGRFICRPALSVGQCVCRISRFVRKRRCLAQKLGWCADDVIGLKNIPFWHKLHMFGVFTTDS